MEENTPNKSSSIQKTIFWTAVSFYLVWKFKLKDPDIKQDLGTWYLFIVQLWTTVMLVLAGLSGVHLFLFIVGKKKTDEGKSESPDS